MGFNQILETGWKGRGEKYETRLEIAIDSERQRDFVQKLVDPKHTGRIMSHSRPGGGRTLILKAEDVERIKTAGIDFEVVGKVQEATDEYSAYFDEMFKSVQRTHHVRVISSDETVLAKAFELLMRDGFLGLENDEYGITEGQSRLLKQNNIPFEILEIKR